MLTITFARFVNFTLTMNTEIMLTQNGKNTFSGIIFHIDLNLLSNDRVMRKSFNLKRHLLGILNIKVFGEILIFLRKPLASFDVTYGCTKRICDLLCTSELSRT